MPRLLNILNAILYLLFEAKGSWDVEFETFSQKGK